MAAPDDITMQNLSGVWVLDKGLSTNLEESIKIQAQGGIPSLALKLLLLAPVSETITETTNKDGTRGFVVAGKAAGLKGPTRTFDGTGQEVVQDRDGGDGFFSKLFGLGSKDAHNDMKGRARMWSQWVDLSSKSSIWCSSVESKERMTTLKHPATGEPLDGYVLEDWSLEGGDGLGKDGMTNFLVFGEKDGMREAMIWGYCRIGGKRFRAIRYHARQGHREVKARLVFGWGGKMEKE
ncbi:hypothetical protein V8F06_012487 [Rhypophila decipiens]